MTACSHNSGTVQVRVRGRDLVLGHNSGTESLCAHCTFLFGSGLIHCFVLSATLTFQNGVCQGEICENNTIFRWYPGTGSRAWSLHSPQAVDDGSEDFAFFQSLSRSFQFAYFVIKCRRTLLLWNFNTTQRAQKCVIEKRLSFKFTSNLIYMPYFYHRPVTSIGYTRHSCRLFK